MNTTGTPAILEIPASGFDISGSFLTPYRHYYFTAANRGAITKESIAQSFREFGEEIGLKWERDNAKEAS